MSGWLLAAAQPCPGGAGGEGLGQVQVASGDLRSSLSSFSRERLALAWFGTRGPESSLPPGPPPALWGCSLALGRCRRACQQGQDESQSSDWPLRHRPLLPAQGRRFSLFWTGFVAFPNQAVLSCSKRLYFSREILQKGNFPLGGCDLAQLGRGVERGSWERPRGESSAENVDASPLGHEGWPGSSRPHCHRTSALGSPRGRELAPCSAPGGPVSCTWGGQGAGQPPPREVCRSAVPSCLWIPRHLAEADTGCWLPGPALPSLALLASSLRREAWPEALLALFLLLL